MVMDSLGIDVDALDSDNMKTFKKMTVDTGVFTYAELVVWFRTLSKLSNCRGLAVCAEEYAHRLVVEGEMDQGRYWLKAEKVYWSFIKQPHYQMLGWNVRSNLLSSAHLVTKFLYDLLQQVHHPRTDIRFLLRHQCQQGPVVFRLRWQASLCDARKSRSPL